MNHHCVYETCRRISLVRYKGQWKRALAKLSYLDKKLTYAKKQLTNVDEKTITENED